MQDLPLKILFAGLFLLDLVPGEALAGETIEEGEKDAGDNKVTQCCEGEDPGDKMEYGVHTVYVESAAIKIYWAGQGKISKR